MIDPIIEGYMKDGQVKLHSNINKYFTPECLLELELLLMNTSIDNNSKIVVCDSILEKYNIPFAKLGGGTNRYGILIDGYVYKIAMDHDGEIDNKREYIYTKEAQPYVIKVYECEAKGIVMVCEYVDVFTLDDYYENQREMKKILSELSSVYFIGDIGIDPKNYYNWGRRDDGNIVILDFAYIYKQSFKTISCPCGSMKLLSYDADYNLLICPECGQKNSFWTLRKRITKEQQKTEIGDIKEKGYVISGYKIDEVQKLNPLLTDLLDKFKPKKKREKKKPVKVKPKKFDEDSFLEQIEQMIDSGEF